MSKPCIKLSVREEDGVDGLDIEIRGTEYDKIDIFVNAFELSPDLMRQATVAASFVEMKNRKRRIEN